MRDSKILTLENSEIKNKNIYLGHFYKQFSQKTNNRKNKKKNYKKNQLLYMFVFGGNTTKRG